MVNRNRLWRAKSGAGIITLCWGYTRAFGGRMSPAEAAPPASCPVWSFPHTLCAGPFRADRPFLESTFPTGAAPFAIVGVTPPEFFGLEVGSSLDVSVPLMMQQQVMPGIRSYVDGADPNSFFNVMGRLRPGVAMPQAQAVLSAHYRQLCAEYSAS